MLVYIHNCVHEEINYIIKDCMSYIYTHRQSKFKGTSGAVESFTASLSNFDTSLEETSVQLKPNFSVG